MFRLTPKLTEWLREAVAVEVFQRKQEEQVYTSLTVERSDLRVCQWHAKDPIPQRSALAAGIETWRALLSRNPLEQFKAILHLTRGPWGVIGFSVGVGTPLEVYFPKSWGLQPLPLADFQQIGQYRYGIPIAWDDEEPYGPDFFKEASLDGWEEMKHRVYYRFSVMPNLKA